MKAKPILFTGENVRAILDARKTQTRRVIRGPGNDWHIDRLLGEWPLSEAPCQWDGEKYPWRWQSRKAPGIGDWIWEVQTDVDDSATWPIRCPYGRPGGLLYVRETWRVADYFDLQKPSKIKPDRVYYDADNSQHYTESMKRVPPLSEWARADFGKTRPSIFMPRDFSRITLRVKRIWVERAQDISAVDAMREGVPRANLQYNKLTIEALGNSSATGLAAIDDFSILWDSINAKRGFGWDVNPWVWAVEFERVTG